MKTPAITFFNELTESPDVRPRLTPIPLDHITPHFDQPMGRDPAPGVGLVEPVEGIYVAGPGNQDFEEAINAYIEDSFRCGPLAGSELHTLGAGSPTETVPLSAISDQIAALPPSDSRPLIVLSAHGGSDREAKHKIKLEDSIHPTPTRDFFKSVSTGTRGAPIDILMSSCHGGASLQSADALPKGSQVVVLSGASESTLFFDFVSLASDLRHRFESGISLHGILLFYLSTTIPLSSTPEIMICGVGHWRLGDELNKCWGQRFSQTQRDRIHENLDELLGCGKVEEYLRVMEAGNGDKAAAKIFGPFLAIALLSSDSYHRARIKAGTNKPILSGAQAARQTMLLRHLADVLCDTVIDTKAIQSRGTRQHLLRLIQDVQRISPTALSTMAQLAWYYPHSNKENRLLWRQWQNNGTLLENASTITHALSRAMHSQTLATLVQQTDSKVVRQIVNFVTQIADTAHAVPSLAHDAETLQVGLLTYLDSGFQAIQYRHLQPLVQLVNAGLWSCVRAVYSWSHSGQIPESSAYYLVEDHLIPVSAAGTSLLFAWLVRNAVMTPGRGFARLSLTIGTAGRAFTGVYRSIGIQGEALRNHARLYNFEQLRKAKRWDLLQARFPEIPWIKKPVLDTDDPAVAQLKLFYAAFSREQAGGPPTVLEIAPPPLSSPPVGALVPSSQDSLGTLSVRVTGGFTLLGLADGLPLAVAIKQSVGITMVLGVYALGMLGVGVAFWCGVDKFTTWYSGPTTQRDPQSPASHSALDQPNLHGGSSIWAQASERSSDRASALKQIASLTK